MLVCFCLHLCDLFYDECWNCLLFLLMSGLYMQQLYLSNLQQVFGRYGGKNFHFFFMLSGLIICNRISKMLAK